MMASAARWHRLLERPGSLNAYCNLFQQLQAGEALPQLSNNARVLDGGIGAGALSLALDQTIGSPLCLEGVDISAEMLRQARQTCRNIHGNVTVTQRDIHTLGFPEQTFDLVMSAHVLEHVPDPQRALYELVRVLRPGAPLLLIVSQPSLWTAVIQWRWRFVAYSP
jgi:demethylmenaquinone methyltransferase/2-methoxy-6-polyprenyl-1,4-benzoquinol methylase